ncbi:hypothetical protein C2I18_08975 [Paenibacillus sp. PK3_47]|uniref:hypothetical protein n=1 Tax=Paenibacillus sp. PK3_47 TaxID=2072642 RepID=UPI00201E3774|nr:hypothetical protein [Paenibacillus sp. PK3_47]UQZ33661.1 hypothetical protein C2I18_08975 [Paenibacillus sp. PK3_47]
MKTTGNLGLKKPDGTDIVDIADLNGNMDILDTAVKAAQDHVSDAVKHITAAERTAWNAKASTAAATSSAAGLMAAADKAKLDGVAAGANNYVHPNHTGDVTSTGDGVTAIAPGVIVDADVNSTAAIGWGKISKTGSTLADLATRSAGDLNSGTLPAARLPFNIDAAKIGAGVVSNAEFGYLDGVTSSIQTQINNTVKKSGDTVITGTLTGPKFSANGTEGITHQATGDTVGLSAYRSGENDYQLRVNNNASGAQQDTTKPTLAMAVDVTKASPGFRMWYRPPGGNSDSWLNTFEVNALTGNLVTKNKDGLARIVAQSSSWAEVYYVRPDGNDANNGLMNTSGGAFKTIGAAIGALPQVITHSITIYVAPGTYNEPVYVGGFSGGGMLKIAGAASAATTHTITGQVSFIRNTCRTEFIGFNLTNTTLNAMQAISCTEAFFQYIRSDLGGSPVALHAENAKAYVNNCVFSRRSTAVLYAHTNGEILSQSNSGSGNATIYQAAYGGRIHGSYDSIVGNVQAGTNDGGIVTTGMGAVNPWGDNTQSQRSYCGAGPIAMQFVPRLTWTKVNYGGEYSDQRNEYDYNLSRFVNREAGIYSISAKTAFDNNGEAMNAHLRLNINGNHSWMLGGQASNINGTVIVGGTITLDMPAGTIIEVLLWTDKPSGATLSSDGTYSNIWITRVA